VCFAAIGAPHNSRDGKTLLLSLSSAPDGENVGAQPYAARIDSIVARNVVGGWNAAGRARPDAEATIAWV